MMLTRRSSTTTLVRHVPSAQEHGSGDRWTPGFRLAAALRHRCRSGAVGAEDRRTEKFAERHQGAPHLACCMHRRIPPSGAFTSPRAPPQYRPDPRRAPLRGAAAGRDSRPGLPVVTPGSSGGQVTSPDERLPPDLGTRDVLRPGADPKLCVAVAPRLHGDSSSFSACHTTT